VVPSVLEATFVAEARTPESLPAVGPPEVAISGRSNVGKSTLLNRLAARRALARTSKTPGRTRGIIFYDLALAGAPVAALRLADMPGYGYAQVSRTERNSWQPLIETYAERRHTLSLFVVLVDARRGLQAEELQLVEWLAALGVPTQLVFTKVDKLTVRERAQLLPPRSSSAGRAPGPPLGPGPNPAPLLVSAETGEGVPALWQRILDAVVAAQRPPGQASSVADESAGA
jgi:GTP-binding protein